METNRNHSDEPTVGINFFESIPPVGLENYLYRWKNPVDLTYVPNSVEDKQTNHDNMRLNKPQDKAAWEQPQLFSEEVRAGLRPLRS